MRIIKETKSEQLNSSPMSLDTQLVERQQKHKRSQSLCEIDFETIFQPTGKNLNDKKIQSEQNSNSVISQTQSLNKIILIETLDLAVDNKRISSFENFRNQSFFRVQQNVDFTSNMLKTIEEVTERENFQTNDSKLEQSFQISLNDKQKIKKKQLQISKMKLGKNFKNKIHSLFGINHIKKSQIHRDECKQVSFKSKNNSQEQKKTDSSEVLTFEKTQQNFPQNNNKLLQKQSFQKFIKQHSNILIKKFSQQNLKKKKELSYYKMLKNKNKKIQLSSSQKASSIKSKKICSISKKLTQSLNKKYQKTQEMSKMLSRKIIYKF